HVLEELGTIISLMKDTVIGQRSFLLTDDDDYLLLIKQAEARIPPAQTKLAELLADNPRQLQRLKELETAIAARLDFAPQSIALCKREREKGKAAGVDMVRSGQGRKLMDEVRKIAGTMEADEQEWLRGRALEAEAAARANWYGIGIGTALALAISVASG